MLRFRPLLLGALVFPACLSAAEPDLGRFAVVDTEPVKTSIYLGSVTLSAGRFLRQGQTYTAAYSARVFPYFFLSESGRLVIDVPEASLLLLAHARSFEFRGVAIRQDGRTRPITGRVIPLTASTGRLKVRLVVTRSLTLVFDSTYRLAGSSQ